VSLYEQKAADKEALLAVKALLLEHAKPDPSGQEAVPFVWTCESCKFPLNPREERMQCKRCGAKEAGARERAAGAARAALFRLRKRTQELGSSAPAAGGGGAGVVDGAGDASTETGNSEPEAKRMR
jgi:hypothetical protein